MLSTFCDLIVSSYQCNLTNIRKERKKNEMKLKNVFNSLVSNQLNPVWMFSLWFQSLFGRATCLPHCMQGPSRPERKIVFSENSFIIYSNILKTYPDLN